MAWSKHGVLLMEELISYSKRILYLIFVWRIDTCTGLYRGSTIEYYFLVVFPCCLYPDTSFIHFLHLKPIIPHANDFSPLLLGNTIPARYVTRKV